MGVKLVGSALLFFSAATLALANTSSSGGSAGNTSGTTGGPSQGNLVGSPSTGSPMNSGNQPSVNQSGERANQQFGNTEQRDATRGRYGGVPSDSSTGADQNRAGQNRGTTGTNADRYADPNVNWDSSTTRGFPSDSATGAELDEQGRQQGTLLGRE